MLLRTLGGLTLEGSDFARPKPLLLLAYLAIEGPKDRRFLADLFWMNASDSLNRLSTSLSRLRKAAPEAIHTNTTRVATLLECDVRQMLAALEGGDGEQALSIYRGPFLDGVHLSDWGEELEEWIYGTREYLAGRIRTILLERAEHDAGQGDFERASARAESAYRLPGAAEPEPSELARYHRLLLAGENPLAAELRREADLFEVELPATVSEARDLLTDRAPAIDSARPIRLPALSTPFIGRQKELAELTGLLGGEAEHRLITVLGPGGIGKTRLVLAAAPLIAEQYRHGVIFVSLAGLTSAGQVLNAIANALGLHRLSRDLSEQLARFLREREMLMILDDCENVTAEAGVVADLLAAAPRLQIVATSRERLELATESVFPLEGLPFEGSAAGPFDSDAMALLMQRARLARPGLALQPDDLEQAAQICRLLRGMPLALVLAAGWLELLSFAELAQELERSLDLLTTEAHDLPPRQRSVRAVFDYSWGRLSDEQRLVFARLALFRGGFSREAAWQVAHAGLQTLRTLAHKSLLYTRPQGRFEIHELLRQFAEEKLGEGERTETLRRHSEHFLTLLARARDELLGRDQTETLGRLAPDGANFRAAWLEAAKRGEEKLLQQSLSPFHVLHVLTARYYDGYRSYCAANEILAASETVEPALLARLRVHEAALLARSGEFPRARLLLEEQLPRLIGPADRGFALETLGHYVLFFMGELEPALERLDEALSLQRQAQDRFGIARTLFFKAALLWHEGEYRESESFLRESCRLVAELENPQWQGFCAAGLGVVAHDQGDLERARTLLEDAARRLERLGLTHAAANANSNLGQVLVEAGEADSGLERLQRALKGFEEVGDPVLACEAHSRIGQAYLQLGEKVAAEKHFRRSLALTLEHDFELSAGMIGLADLLCESDRKQALALYLFVTAHQATPFADRRVAKGRLHSLRPRPDQLVEARRRAGAVTFRELVSGLLDESELASRRLDESELARGLLDETVQARRTALGGDSGGVAKTKKSEPNPTRAASSTKAKR